MNRIGHIISVPTFCLAVVSLSLIGMTDYTFAGDQILSRDLVSRVASQGTPDEHRGAALLYRERALQLEAEAAQYAREAAGIKSLEDTKGFRRGALKMAAGSLQRQADEMKQLSVVHQKQADSMTAHQKEQ
jgi:hypothetical protein